MTKQTVRIFGPFQGKFEVHATDCADCKKAAQRTLAAGVNDWQESTESRETLAASVYADQIREGSDVKDCLAEFTSNLAANSPNPSKI